MMKTHDTQSSTKATKRNSFRKSLLMAAASLSLSAVALPAAASTWWSATPSVSIGSASINVRNKGALGNGSHDDTAAFQAAINALPSSGGTVYVPAGRYMINALKPVRLRSHTRLLMDSSAELDVIPNSEGRYYLIKVWNVNNVKIVGGQMVGDRYKHLGTTGEWGYGINISGASNVLVRNVHLSNFWGDGLWIGATGSGSTLVRSNYVTLNGVVSSNNRRQGASIGPSHHVYIVNSTFSKTHGTLPEAGIDIEPLTQGPTDTVRLEKNTFSGNHGNGIETHANISAITIINNVLSSNNGFGMLSVSSVGITATENYATRNGLAGIGLSGTTHSSGVHGNKLQYNSTHYISPTHTGGGSTRDLQIGSKTYWLSIYSNSLTP